MRRLILLFSLVLLLGGCITTGPTNNVDFGKIETIRELEGVYQNLGEREQGAYPIYLSQVIWPKTVGIDHAAITTIEVRLLNPNTLGVRASSNNGVEKEDTFVEGKDFEIHSGRIRLKQSFRIAGFRSGDLIVGPTYERDELGLDRKGHGKLSKQGGFVGLVVSLIPMAIGVNEDVRFVRIDKVPNP
ncbi:MAG TPA: hypothetical protein VGB26_06730 [Nitrospiria bacterium]